MGLQYLLRIVWALAAIRQSGTYFRPFTSLFSLTQLFMDMPDVFDLEHHVFFTGMYSAMPEKRVLLPWMLKTLTSEHSFA